MSGHTKWNEIKHKVDALPDAEERKAAARSDLEAAQERFDMTLGQLRKARNLTQAQLADELGVQQSHVSRTEARADVYLSTLERYIEAMGGHLEVVAIFDDAEVRLELGDLTERQDEREAAAAAVVEESFRTPATA